MTVFTLDYCIRYPACSVTEIAAKELKSVDFSDTDNDDFMARFSKNNAGPDLPHQYVNVTQQAVARRQS